MEDDELPSNPEIAGLFLVSGARFSPNDTMIDRNGRVRHQFTVVGRAEGYLVLTSRDVVLRYGYDGSKTQARDQRIHPQARRLEADALDKKETGNRTPLRLDPRIEAALTQLGHGPHFPSQVQ